MTTPKYYKVVKPYKDRWRSPVDDVWETMFGVEYVVGEITYPCIVGSKLFVFSSVHLAVEYMFGTGMMSWSEDKQRYIQEHNAVVMECTVSNPTVLPMMNMVLDESLMLSYWKKPEGWPTFLLSESHFYTLADSVVLLREAPEWREIFNSLMSEGLLTR